ncbi:hypothetical protein COOONC_15503 [Cooperia oncophora]
MRAYWKNCYGYDLPLKEPENYYDVWFNGIRSSFLYPDFCVLSSEPQPIGFLEEQATTLAAMSAFMQSFSSEEHFICGEYCGLFPSDSKFLKPPGRALKTTPYSRRAAPNKHIFVNEGHGVASSKQEQKEICTGAEMARQSRTKEYLLFETTLAFVTLSELIFQRVIKSRPRVGSLSGNLSFRRRLLRRHPRIVERLLNDC